MSSSTNRAEAEQVIPPEAHWLHAWHVNPSSNADYGLIDGLRGIAILLVLVCHFFYINPESGRVMHFFGGLFGAGGAGVYMFFGLSGFLIAWPFWKRKVSGSNSVVPRGYGWRRFWKIYPPLAFSVIALTPFYIRRFDDWSFVPIAIQWLTGLAFLVPVSDKLNPVMWSLVVEIQFYIVIPLVFLLARRLSAKACLWIITGAFVVIPWGCQRLVYGGVGPIFHPSINSHFPSGLLFFAFGILVAGLESLGLMRPRWAPLGNVGFFLLFLLLVLSGWFTIHPPTINWGEISRWLVIAGTGLLLCFVADPRYWMSKWLCFAPLRWFGLISYELYLVHQPIILWAREDAGPGHGSFVRYVALLGGCFIVSVTIAALLYRFFSLPILKSGRQKHSPSGSAASEAKNQ